MLKRLVIICVLLGCVGWTWSQVPRNGGHKDEKPQQANRQPQVTPTIAEIPPRDQAAPNQEQKADSKPPQYPWRELYAPANIPNWLLTVVAGIAGWLAYRTLRAINRQADLMKDQLDTARQKERPKLRLELDEVNLKFTESPDMVLAGCKIHNYGGSIAFIVGSLCACWVGEITIAEDRQHGAFSMNLPEVLKPGESFGDTAVILADDDKVVDMSLWNADDPRIESVRKGERSIYISGFIMYTTIFDETWMFAFRRKYTVQHYGPGFSQGQWAHDRDAENYERQEIPNPN